MNLNLNLIVHELKAVQEKSLFEMQSPLWTNKVCPKEIMKLR